MSYLLIEQKYRILNNKIDILYNQLQSEIFKLKEENNLLLTQMNSRLHNINDMNTINIETITTFCLFCNNRCREPVGSYE